MTPLVTLAEIEKLYARVLELSLKQEDCLKQSAYGELEKVLVEKGDAVEQASTLMIELKGDPADMDDPLMRAGIQRLGQRLAEVMKVEERCRSYTPQTEVKPPASAAMSAYAKAR